MLNEKTIDHICPECQTELNTFSGISKKTGKPFTAHKCPECGYIEFEKTFPKKVNKEAITVDEINDFRKEFNERFDGLAEFLSKFKTTLTELDKTLKRFESDDKVVFYPENKEIRE